MNSLYTSLKKHFFLIAGPCVVENEEICFEVAEKIKELSDIYQLPVIFKSSYRKANRTSGTSFTGIGDANALLILSKVKELYDLPITTDIHSDEEAETVSNLADIIQIPAFLCRQTSLLMAAAKTGKIVNIKKGQFMSPESMLFSLEKVKMAGNGNVILTERGTTFGYSDLIVDMKSIPVMQKFEVPVVLDCTHSLQRPNQSKGVTGGNPQFIKLMARAGTATGANGLFIETHPKPEKALSDGANMLPLSQLSELIEEALSIRQVVSKFLP